MWARSISFSRPYNVQLNTAVVLYERLLEPFALAGGATEEVTPRTYLTQFKTHLNTPKTENVAIF